MREIQTSYASGPDVQLKLINEEAEAGVIECGGSWMEDGMERDIITTMANVTRGKKEW